MINHNLMGALLMRYSDLSDSEIKRLVALQKLRILDSPFEQLFDNVTMLASIICKTPISLISFIDRSRQWFKFAPNLDYVRATPSEYAFFGNTILSEGILEVCDSLIHERFRNNPLVSGNSDIRFYAGAPITLPFGEKVGTICVIDTVSKQLSSAQKLSLEGLANVVSHSLSMRNNIMKQIDPSMGFKVPNMYI